ncbi:MAG TPA: ATP-binding protein, partial [Chthonomonadales bacterium]|nr:ATP-binding protein [Chthonomonadales bacterium]
SLYEEMQENYQNIRRLKSYTDNVLQSIGAAILSTDSHGVVVRWNRAAEETLQRPASYFRNTSLTEVINKLYLPESESRDLLHTIEKVLESGARHHEHKLTLHPDGREPITINLLLSRLTDHGQERSGVVLIFEDVTQEARLEAELEKIRRLADIGQLAAKMAHEVRNALSPIKGAAQIMRVEAESQSASTEWPDIIISEVDGLSRLTSEMLDFARPTNLSVRPMSVNEFLVASVLSLSAYLSERSITVHWQFTRGLPEIQADQNQLGQVVRNIVMNAAQAMQDGGDLYIGTDYDARAQHVAMRFRDIGPGIKPQELDRIFRPFVTTKPKGTGLGLPIVQKIVDHHGGVVLVDSVVDTGTCFSVLLPLCPPGASGGLAAEGELIPEGPLISTDPLAAFPDN